MNLQPRILFSLWLLMLVNYLDRVAIGFAGPSIMASLGMSPAEFGVVLSSFGVGYLLAQLPGGMLADRFGAKTLLVIGPMMWAAFTGATALVTGLVAFAIVRVCFGISEGLSNPSVYKIIGESFEARKRARALAILSTAIPLAPAFAGALIGKLIAAFGWHMMFLLMAVPSLLVAVSSYLLLPRAPTVPRLEVADGTGKRAFRDVMARPSLWLLAGASIAFNIPYWGFLGWMPSYLALARHIDLKASGALSGIPYIFAFLGMVIIGWLGSSALHRYCLQLIVGCFVAAGMSLFFAYQAHSLVLALGGLSSTAFFLFGSHGPIGKVVLDFAPTPTRATYVGVYTTAGQIGGILAPALIGLMVGATGTFAGGFALMVGGFAVACGCLIALLPLARAQRSVTVTP